MARTRIVITVGKHDSLVRGWQAKDLLTEAGCRPFWVNGGWQIQSKRLPDVCAWLDYRSVRYRLEDVVE